jgi:branched-chain amino acid transport system ATP-binding protein
VALFAAERLHMRFGDRVVLENVSFAAEDGELAGIIGPNGAGKTTFFNVLTGRYRPTRGRVLFAGEDITGTPPHLIARKGIARSFQLMNLFNEMSARENVTMALPQMRARGFDMARDATRDRVLADAADAVLARVGLENKATLPARSLSYGDRRALEIAVALASSPRVLCLDEPTSGLGSEASSRLAALIHALKRRLTIVIIEHDMAFLLALADTITVIHWGQVIARGTPASLRENPWVRASNLGKLA